ncbi:TetR/AcrR family transcriptional regulator [Brevibacillus ginsengisoli]|uniref:TetR/AcrR family transcriptional regulator n=1 Tax=Brevibacillus ginsengisoli TaxID=363854 RepID=UPI003CE9A2D1
MARKTGITITKDEILDAALLEFSRNGYDGTKVSSIAKASGITPAAIYIHFTSKEDLFHQLLTREFDKASITPPATALSLRDLLIHMGNQLVQIFKNHPAFTKIIFIEGIKNPAIANPLYKQILRQATILEEELLRHFQLEPNERNTSLINYASRFFLGAIGWAEMTLDVFDGREQEPVDDALMVELYTDFFLNGLQGLKVNEK